MEESTNTETIEPVAPTADPPPGSPLAGIIDTAKKVITDPAGFFREMPKTGGFGKPFAFLMILSLAGAIVEVLLSIVGLGTFGSFTMSLMFIVLIPLYSAIFFFIGAALIFVVWKLMGSQESYQTAYRCCAYMSAVTPIIFVISEIPYLGMLISMAWMLFLIVTASTEVHKIKSKTAWTVFGIIFVIFGIMGIMQQCAVRKMGDRMQPWTEMMEETDEMSPEDAGKAVGEFLKGLQETTEGE